VSPRAPRVPLPEPPPIFKTFDELCQKPTPCHDDSDRCYVQFMSLSGIAVPRSLDCGQGPQGIQSRLPASRSLSQIKVRL
jgi:hypothetical protein